MKLTLSLEFGVDNLTLLIIKILSYKLENHNCYKPCKKASTRIAHRRARYPLDQRHIRESHAPRRRFPLTTFSRPEWRDHYNCNKCISFQNDQKATVTSVSQVQLTNFTNLQ